MEFGFSLTGSEKISATHMYLSFTFINLSINILKGEWTWYLEITNQNGIRTQKYS